MKHIEAEILQQHANDLFRNLLKQLINESNHYIVIFINYTFDTIVITVGFTTSYHVSQLLHQDAWAHLKRQSKRSLEVRFRSGKPDELTVIRILRWTLVNETLLFI